MTTAKNIDTYLASADSLRFKLWLIIGKNLQKKDRISTYLKSLGYTLVDVGSELSELTQELSQTDEPDYDLGEKIKAWFFSKPDKLILTNASILYHDVFLGISPVGAFKYNARSKNCVLFLEDEQMIGNRIYHGKVGSDEFYDKDINEVLKTQIEEIDDDVIDAAAEPITDYTKLTSPDAIGHLFNYTVIKDVIDIDTDLKVKNQRKDLISSYIISEGLDQQIIDFFENLSKPNHKAVKIVGNYGSGKSHLIAFLVTVVNNPEFRYLIQNNRVRNVAEKINRSFFTVQFELQPIAADLSTLFFYNLEKQLKQAYNLDIPKFGNHILDIKEHLSHIISLLKEKEPKKGLFVIIDEVSDFIQSKESHNIKLAFQFLRVVAQVCQDEDLMFVTSMQEDIYSSPKLQNIAADEGRISERFQNIIIRREAVQNVIAQRIVPKTAQQRLDIETKLKPYATKIENIANKMEEYVDLFPFTPSLLMFFQELPFFEKRGVIQFAQNALKYRLNEPFPFFFSFERIFDLLESNPNQKNLEGVYDIIKVVNIIKQKIDTNIEDAKKVNALRIVKGLALYALWGKGQNGATAKELAELLLIIPVKGPFEAHIEVAMTVKKLREATDNFYLKVVQDEATGNHYFKLDPNVDGKDPEERIENEINAIGGDEDKQEAVIFDQIKEILSLEYYKNQPNTFHHECIWQSVKSYRRGLVVFNRKGQEIKELENVDYVINFISPFSQAKPVVYCANQLNIALQISSASNQSNIEFLKRIVAIKSLIEKNIMTSVMRKKLHEAIDGYTNTKGVKTPGIKERLTRVTQQISTVTLRGDKISVSQKLGKEYNNLHEAISNLAAKVFDAYFNDGFPEHPKYAQQLTSANISNSLTTIANEIVNANFTSLRAESKSFLNTLNLLNANGDPDLSQNKIIALILEKVAKAGTKVVDINKEIVQELVKSPYGLEPEIVHFLLVVLTTLGKVGLKAKGGDDIDITNIKEKFKNISQFENIVYVLKKEDLSYDFAHGLLNAMGLQGAKILLENTRNDAFKDYKRKVQDILNNLKDTERKVQDLVTKKDGYLNIVDLSAYFNKIKAIDWQALDINNFVKFNQLAHFQSQLPEMKTALGNLENLKDAINDYNQLTIGVNYMREAIDILRGNNPYLLDPLLSTKLTQLYDDTLTILKDFNRFIQRGERYPLQGKIAEFKKGYVNEFYYPAHERTIGKKIDWSPYEQYRKHPKFDAIWLLRNLECNAPSKITSKVQEWGDILKMRHLRVDIEALKRVPFNTESNFMKVVQNYDIIKTEAPKIETTLDTIYQEYSQTAINEVRLRANKLPLIKITEGYRQDIQSIIDSGEMPPIFNEGLMTAINKLFVDIKIVALKKEDVLDALFKKDELITVEQLREAFYSLENHIKQQNKGDIRLKLE